MSVPDFIDHAIVQIAELFKPRFAVTINAKKISKKRSTVIRFDPSLPKSEQNKLLLVDDKDPSPQQLEEFARKVKRSSGRDSEADKDETRVSVDTSQIDKMIVRKSFREVKASNADELAYEFDVKSDNLLLGRVVKQISGTMFFEAATQRLLRVSLNNKKTISVIPTVSIKQLDAEAIFEPVGPDNELVVVQTRYKVLGKKLIVSKIWEENETTYTDYEVKENGSC